MPTPSSLIYFGTFQLDLKARELHKAGVKVKLQGQPFRVLALLSENAGQVVTREELRQKVWPTDVYVDFDQGLNNAIKKVREALGDSAESPRFIETLARQGYRFIAAVSAPPTAPLEAQPDGRWRTARLALTAATATALLAVLGYWAWHQGAMHHEKVILAVLPFDNLNHDPEQDFFSDFLQ
jgi:DNA-binding winged helix-turn-helix (wHTH) protein